MQTLLPYFISVSTLDLLDFLKRKKTIINFRHCHQHHHQLYHNYHRQHHRHHNDQFGFQFKLKVVYFYMITTEDFNK